MPWDDELERLATFVRAHFGTEAFEAAGRRALTQLSPLDVADEDATEQREDVMRGSDGYFYNVEEFSEAVRRELQRLVTPH